MSKIGKQPIIIPEGVSVNVKGNLLEVSGKNALLKVAFLPGIKAEVRGSELFFTALGETKQILSNWGTMRALAQNAILGAVRNFVKELIIEGVGFRANVEGQNLMLYIGFSHPVKFAIPEGIKIEIDKNIIRVSGADKALVGEVASKIRKFKKPEPYKGKGIRYVNEIIRRKAGKKAVATTK